MEEMRFTIVIQASREHVWSVLWEDTTFRVWADFIDKGTYMIGEFQEGNEVQFISAVNGYGVTSLIEELKIHESITLRHSADEEGYIYEF